MVLENTLTQWGEIIPEVAFLFYSYFIRFSEKHLFNFLTIAAYMFHEYRILIGNKSAASKRISSHCDLTSTVPNFFSLSLFWYTALFVYNVLL